MVIKLIVGILLLKTSFAQEYIQLGNSNNIKPFQSYLEETPGVVSQLQTSINIETQKNSKLLQAKYKLATDQLLNEDLSSSIHLFKEIVNSTKSSIFKKNVKKIISNSYLFLATLEKEHISHWTKLAALYDQSFSPSTQVFNPLVVDTFKDHVSHIRLKPLTPVPKLENYIVFINGTRSLESYPQNNKYYVTIYREGHLLKKLSLFSHEFRKLTQIKLIKKNFGTCLHPNFSHADRVFYSSKCIKSKFNNSLLNYKLAKEAPLIDLSIKPIKKPLLKRKSTWIAIGTSIAVTSAVLFINDTSKSKKFKPVHTVSNE